MCEVATFAPQRAVRRKRLRVGDVEPERPERAAVEQGLQGCLVEHGAAADVDDHSTRCEQTKLLLTDQSASVPGERQCEDQGRRAGDRVPQLVVAEDLVVRSWEGFFRPPAHDADAEPQWLQQLRDVHRDPAASDDRDHVLRPDQRDADDIGLPCTRVGVQVKAASQSEQHGHGVFGDCGSVDPLGARPEQLRSPGDQPHQVFHTRGGKLHPTQHRRCCESLAQPSRMATAPDQCGGGLGPGQDAPTGPSGTVEGSIDIGPDNSDRNVYRRRTATQGG